MPSVFICLCSSSSSSRCSGHVNLKIQTCKQGRLPAPGFCSGPDPARIQQQVGTFALTFPPQLDIQALQGVGRVPFLQREPSKQAASHPSPHQTSTPYPSPILPALPRGAGGALLRSHLLLTGMCKKKLRLAERLLFCMNERRREKQESGGGGGGGEREGGTVPPREGRTGGGSNSPQVLPAGVNPGKQRVGLWERGRG